MAPPSRHFVRLWILVLSAWFAMGATARAVVFTDATTAAGIAYPLPDPIPPLTDNPISQTGGAAAGDFDNDGWPDLFISRYWDAPILYRNNQNGTFSDVTASAFSAGLPGPKSTGGSWGDVDNDGDLDLYVPTVFNGAGSYLYMNDGAGHFTEQASARGAKLGGVSYALTSASFGDYDNDGYLDMYVGEWRKLSAPNSPHARLLRNLGAAQPGYFEDVTAASGAAMGPLSGQGSYSSLSYTPRFVDFDRDGHADVLVASDAGTSRLFWNNGDGTFSNGTPAIAANLGFNDMGLAIGDVDGNGLLDWFTTDICQPTSCNSNMMITGNRLFRNFGNRVFLESSVASGVRDAGWGWGTELFDFDNDKDVDVVATNGYYASPVYETDPVRLWANDGAGIASTFTDVAGNVGITDTGQGRGLLTFDYDRDGDLDVFIVNNYGTPVLYRNDGGNEGDWLRIETVGTISNADGVGAFITVTPDLALPTKKLVHEISESSSFLSQSEPIAHFGLGANADLVDLIRIEWPASGIVQELRNVSPNQLLSIVERHPCDFNGNGRIDAADYSVWRNSLGQTVAHGSGADANGDGLVDAQDYALWKAHFGEVFGIASGAGSAASAGHAVPEPASWVLVLVALLGGCRARAIRQRFLGLLAIIIAAWSVVSDAASAQGVMFSDATAAAGITHSIASIPESETTNPGSTIALTGGAAAGDFDGDGWPDLFVTRYWDTPILYRNNQDGTFADVTAAAFPAGVIAAKSNGASWGDVDNDGDVDLYVTTVNDGFGNHLYMNDGAGHFTQEAAARGASLNGSPVAFMSSSFGDYDNDGYLDMYVGEWRAFSNPTPTRSRLLRNLGAAQPGHFEDVTAASGAAMGPLSDQVSYIPHTFTPRFADFDRDGYADVLVASDFGTSRLFWNNGDGTFTDGTPAIAANLGASDMGLAIGDVDGNGLLDFMTTDIYVPADPSTGNRLFRNFGNRQFLETSVASGVRNGFWGWGIQMIDYDNDKDLDVVHTNGHYVLSPIYQTDPVRLFTNNGAGIASSFAEDASSRGITDTAQGRGLLTFDYDRDGDLDVFIVNNYGTPVLYRNDGGNEGDWLRIETVGTISNADGVGAFITVTPDLALPTKKLVHEISESSSFLSQSEPIAHFGLGANADLVDLIRIEWPASGIVQELRNVSPNQLLSIVERHPCDFNGNGRIDAADYSVWRNSLGQTVAHGSGADANGDGLVDTQDYALWKAHFGELFGIGSGAGSAASAGHAVPEPTSWVLVLVALLAGCRRSRIRLSTSAAPGLRVGNCIRLK